MKEILNRKINNGNKEGSQMTFLADSHKSGTLAHGI